MIMATRGADEVDEIGIEALFMTKNGDRQCSRPEGQASAWPPDGPSLSLRSTRLFVYGEAFEDKGKGIAAGHHKDAHQSSPPSLLLVWANRMKSPRLPMNLDQLSGERQTMAA